MTTPKMNEDMLIAALSVPLTRDSSERLKQLAAYSILAAYDRKVGREFMEKVVTLAIGLAKISERVENLNMAVDMIQRGELSSEPVIAKSRQIAVLSTSYQERLADMVALLRECPLDEDTQH